MTNLHSTLRPCMVVIIVAAIASLAQGQATKTWVSGVGDDANACSRTAPCRTFTGAVGKTAIGGDISVLDSGSFGPVTINKSVTIDGTGSMAIIVGAQSSGITINLTNPADLTKTVRIRGISLNGLGAGMDGITVLAASRVSIEDTTIDGFSANGISVSAGQVFVRNTTIRNNANFGIKVASGAQVGISDVSVVFNGTGLAGPIVPFNNIVLYANKSGPVSP